MEPIRMNMTELTETDYLLLSESLAGLGRQGEILRTKHYSDEKGARMVRIRTPLETDEIRGILEPKKVEVPKMTEDAKTMQTPPAEGISQIGEGIHRMMGAFLGPSIAAVEARVAEMDSKMAAAKAELKHTEEAIQERIEAALAAPEQLFQDALAALNRLETRLTALETATEAKFDERRRDFEVLRGCHNALVTGLRGLGKE